VRFALILIVGYLSRLPISSVVFEMNVIIYLNLCYLFRFNYFKTHLMPSSEYNEFSALINSLDQTDELAKFNDNEQFTLLKNIKFYIGRVSDEQINRMFSDKSNRSNLFKFLINSSYDDDASEILFLNESYDVIERLLSAYRHMQDLFDALNDQFLFLFTQTGDAYERIQFMCLQTFYTLASKIDKQGKSF
jgi:hypothetical protein